MYPPLHRKKRILQMERVLKAVPADLRVKMEALVHDLTLALEESNNSANVRRRWGIRRRARSTGNIRKYERLDTEENSISILVTSELNSKKKKHLKDKNSIKLKYIYSNTYMKSVPVYYCKAGSRLLSRLFL